MNVGQKVAFQADGAITADHSAYGTITECPAIDVDGAAHPELAWVNWPDMGADLVSVDNLYPINL